MKDFGLFTKDLRHLDATLAVLQFWHVSIVTATPSSSFNLNKSRSSAQYTEPINQSPDKHNKSTESYAQFYVDSHHHRQTASTKPQFRQIIHQPAREYRTDISHVLKQNVKADESRSVKFAPGHTASSAASKLFRRATPKNDLFPENENIIPQSVWISEPTRTSESTTVKSDSAGRPKEAITVTPESTGRPKEVMTVTPESTGRPKEVMTVTPESTGRPKEVMTVTPESTGRPKEAITMTSVSAIRPKEAMTVTPESTGRPKEFTSESTGSSATLTPTASTPRSTKVSLELSRTHKPTLTTTATYETAIRPTRHLAPVLPHMPAFSRTPTLPREPELPAGTRPRQKTPVTVLQKTPATVLQKTPFTVPQKTPATVLQNTPVTVLQKTPATVLQNTPVTVLQKTPATVVQKTPVTVLQNTPATVLQNTPVTVVQKTPVTVLQNTPATVLRNTPVTVLEKIPATVVQKTPVKTSSSVLQTTPTTVLQTTPTTVLQKTPATVLQNTPATVLRNTPVTVLEKIPATVVQKTPVTVLQKTSSSVLQTTPTTVLQKTPATVLQNTPATVLRNTPVTVLEKIPATVVQKTPVTVLQKTSSSVLQTTPTTVLQTTPATVLQKTLATVLQKTLATVLQKTPTLPSPPDLPVSTVVQRTPGFRKPSAVQKTPDLTKSRMSPAAGQTPVITSTPALPRTPTLSLSPESSSSDLPDVLPSRRTTDSPKTPSVQTTPVPSPSHENTKPPSQGNTDSLEMFAKILNSSSTTTTGPKEVHFRFSGEETMDCFRHTIVDPIQMKAIRFYRELHAARGSIVAEISLNSELLRTTFCNNKTEYTEQNRKHPDTCFCVLRVRVRNGFFIVVELLENVFSEVVLIDGYQFVSCKKKFKVFEDNVEYSVVAVGSSEVVDIVWHLSERKDKPGRFVMRFKELDTRDLQVTYKTNITGAVHTPFHRGRPSFLISRLDTHCATVDVPSGHVIMTSAPSGLVTAYVMQFVDDSGKITQEYFDKEYTVYTAVHKTSSLRFCYFPPTLYKTWDLHGFSGFEFYFSFLNDPNMYKRPHNLWNCSVPYRDALFHHLACNLRSECTDRADEASCSYSSDTCGPGYMTLGGGCFFLSMVKAPITWNMASDVCRSSRTRLAILDSTNKWDDAMKVLPYSKDARLRFFLGIRTMPRSLPSW